MVRSILVFLLSFAITTIAVADNTTCTAKDAGMWWGCSFYVAGKSRTIAVQYHATLPKQYRKAPEEFSRNLPADNVPIVIISGTIKDSHVDEQTKTDILTMKSRIMKKFGVKDGVNEIVRVTKRGALVLDILISAPRVTPANFTEATAEISRPL